MSVSDYALGLVAVRQVHEQCREEENDRRDHEFEQCPYLAEFRRWVKADQDIAVITATSGASDTAEARASQPLMLDVERLAQAMVNVRPYGGNPNAWALVAAREVDAEYERLSSSRPASLDVERRVDEAHAFGYREGYRTALARKSAP